MKLDCGATQDLLWVGKADLTSPRRLQRQPEMKKELFRLDYKEASSMIQIAKHPRRGQYKLEISQRKGEREYETKGRGKDGKKGK